LCITDKKALWLSCSVFFGSRAQSREQYG
jgi:hypothetical protein